LVAKNERKLATTIMVQGAASHVGKSALVAALCRILMQDGYRVAPFKSWNMALNSYVTADGGEIGRAQGEQAEAAGIEASVHLNPILVKPKGVGQAEVIVRGRHYGNVDYETRSQEAYLNFSLQIIGESLAFLRREFEIIVLEGAGSPAEINLQHQDVANMKAAALASAPVLLVCDIERGGALAAAVGTMLLLPEEDRKRVAGFIFNKFRGERAILEPGLKIIEEKTGVPVLGVVPYLPETGLGEEDGVALECSSAIVEHETDRLRVCVIRLPYVANFTDFAALAREKDVFLFYGSTPQDLVGIDAVILPGTKNSILAMRFLQESGLAQMIIELAGCGVPVVGICGGYQLLGQSLADLTGGEGGGEPILLSGLGLLPTETSFYAQKRVKRTNATARLPFAFTEEVEGYEIHMGQTERAFGSLPAFLLENGTDDGAVSADGTVWGTYLHGLFERPGFRRSWLNMLRARRNWPQMAASAPEDKGSRFDLLADAVRSSLDMSAIYRLLSLPGPRKVGRT
jgi:adenosylcobyric acid synthase